MTTRLLALAAAVGLLSGCLENAASIQAASICAMPDDCTFPSDGCSVQYIGPIELDVASTDRLNMAIQVDNNLPVNEDEQGHVNTNDAEIRRASITYSTPGFPLASRTQSISIWVNANTSGVIWFNPIPPEAWLEIVTAGVVPAWNPADPATTVHITANVTFSGVLADGSSFEVAPKPVPIALCSGCFPDPTCDAGLVPFACGGVYQAPRGRVACTENGNAPIAFRLGGRVTGLTGNDLQITCTPGGTITVDSDGTGDQTFLMGNTVLDGSTFDCSLNDISTGQTCLFQGGSGTGTVSGSDVTSIWIDCT